MVPVVLTTQLKWKGLSFCSIYVFFLSFKTEDDSSFTPCPPTLSAETFAFFVEEALRGDAVHTAGDSRTRDVSLALLPP